MTVTKRDYLVQIGDTQPSGWRTVRAATKQDAVLAVLADLSTEGEYVVYLALGLERHANGAPLCVQSYRCTFNQ